MCAGSCKGNFAFVNVCAFCCRPCCCLCVVLLLLVVPYEEMESIFAHFDRWARHRRWNRASPPEGSSSPGKGAWLEFFFFKAGKEWAESSHLVWFSYVYHRPRNCELRRSYFRRSGYDEVQLVLAWNKLRTATGLYLVMLALSPILRAATYDSMMMPGYSSGSHSIQLYDAPEASYRVTSQISCCWRLGKGVAV